MTITRTGVWIAATAVVCVLLLVAAWFLVVGPQRAEAAQTRVATDTTRAQNGQLERRISELEAEFALLPQRREELAAIREALPAEPALSTLLDDLDAVAVDTGSRLDSVVVGTPTTVIDAVVTPEPSVTGEPTGTDAAGADGDGTGAGGTEPGVVTEAVPASPFRLSAGTAGTAGTGGTAGAAGGATAAAPGSAAPGGAAVLAAIPVTITVGGDFFAAAAFVETVQSDLVRALIVDSVDVVTDTGESGTGESGSVVATVTGRVFVFVDPEAVDATADPTAGPTGAPTPSPTTAPTTGPTASPTTGPEATDD